MVDGVKVGEIISSSSEDRFGEDGCSDGTYIDAQDFQDADMVVIKRKPLSAQDGEDRKQDDPKLIYECYGLYGDTLVSSTVSGTNIKDINKKYVWAIRKPYILNGD